MANQTCRAVSAKTLLFVKEEENGIKMDGLVSSERFFLLLWVDDRFTIGKNETNLLRIVVNKHIRGLLATF